MFFFFGSQMNFNPGQLSGCMAWYDFSDSKYLTLSSTAITQALDRSGNGNDTVVQATSTARPTWAANQQNGKASATFDGGDNLELPAAILTLPTANNTVFSVAKRNTEAGTTNYIYSLIEAGVTVNNALNFGSVSGSVNYFNSAGVAIAKTGVTNTNYQIIAGRISGTTQGISVNGSAETTNASGTYPVTANTAYIGSNGAAQSFLTGAESELIMYNRSLTNAEKAQVERYLSRKWGIVLV